MGAPGRQSIVGIERANEGYVATVFTRLGRGRVEDLLKVAMFRGLKKPDLMERSFKDNMIGLIAKLRLILSGSLF
jgi:hypothetical protein